MDFNIFISCDYRSLMLRNGYWMQSVSFLNGRFCGKDLRYLLSKCEAGCEPVVYQSAIYIFSPDGTCVTLYPLPRWFGEPRHYDGKRKVRDAYRWMKQVEAEMSMAGELA